jgi:cell wall-associated NlpC family hydrolase
VVLGGVLVIALSGSRHANAAPAGSHAATTSADSHAIAPARSASTGAASAGTGAQTRIDRGLEPHGRAAGKAGGDVGALAATGDGEAAAGAVAEAPDPEESKSFPAPASSVHHSAAAKPSVAAEEVVAPGAPSNAEVRQELGRMHAVENAARQQEKATATTVPGGDSIGGNGQLPIPQDIPEVVQRVIAGANAIADFPYVFGGGHASFVSNSYDCSGSVSYALAAGGLLSVPETSGTLESWGAPGPGKWITIYANAGHVYMYVNIGGRWMRFDTVGRSGPYASRWQPDIRSNEGFVARHWPGL